MVSTFSTTCNSGFTSSGFYSTTFVFTVNPFGPVPGASDICHCFSWLVTLSSISVFCYHLPSVSLDSNFLLPICSVQQSLECPSRDQRYRSAPFTCSQSLFMGCGYSNGAGMRNAFVFSSCFSVDRIRNMLGCSFFDTLRVVFIS